MPDASKIGRIVAATIACVLTVGTEMSAGQTITTGLEKQYVAAGIFETGLTAEMPVDADCPAITLSFASRYNRTGKILRSERHGAYHAGVDWALPEGTPIIAIADGRVADKGDDPGDPRGNFVAIEHRSLPGGITSNYVHLSGFNVDIYEEVKKGQVIGFVGQTGKGASFVHLHLNVFGEKQRQVGKRKWRYRYDYLQFLSGDMTPIDPVTKRNQKVKVSYVDQFGKVHPPEAKVIWPFICESKGN